MVKKVEEQNQRLQICPIIRLTNFSCERISDRVISSGEIYFWADGALNLYQNRVQRNKGTQRGYLQIITTVSQPIRTYMGAGFGWVIGVINSGCISIQNVLLRRGIHNGRLGIQNGCWTYIINKEHVSPRCFCSLHCEHKENKAFHAINTVHRCKVSTPDSQRTS